MVRLRKIKISVIMAAYNVAAYVDEAIQSVLGQKGVPFELLIGDDASTDGTWARIRGYAPDPGVRIWRFSSWKRVGEVRNLLISQAKGPYLTLCDADDVLLPGSLNRMAKLLDRENDAAGIYGDILWINKKGLILSRKPKLPGLRLGWDLLGMPFPHAGTLFRKDLFERVGGYHPERMPLDDYDLFLRMSELAPFKPLNDGPTYLWRWRSDSLTHSTPPQIRRKLEWEVRREAIWRRYGVALTQAASSPSKTRS